MVRGFHAACKPLVGICFGHQLICHALGGAVAPRPPFHIAVDDIEPTAAAAAYGFGAAPLGLHVRVVALYYRSPTSYQFY